MKEAYRQGYRYAEMGKPASRNPYSGKEDRELFNKGYYAWLIQAQRKYSSNSAKVSK